MKTLLVIPARYASTRYPGKPLVALVGRGGVKKSLIQRSWEAATSVCGVDRVVVATDDKRIRETAEAFGAEVIMTSSTCVNGTERCAEAHATLGNAYDVVINFQGDAPLTPSWFVEALIDDIASDASVSMTTPVLQCDGRALKGLLDDRKAGRVGGTTVVFDAAKYALYFSKEVVPRTTTEFADNDPTPVHHHVGVYAYRSEALRDYLSWPEGPLERLEGLEQLRFLENGHRIKCVKVQSRGRQFWELNNPSDIERIESILTENGTE
ncbi:3-deoxy-manno-octulosonate cytidylyltransferase [Celeribacter sp.]|uniref:3-deoxy-manno-octulosonate cytidylyltransferase n=1 Tax=Celeribacter sp. TaxID=1890673 RepID=UPI003A94D941